jgi:hypothetical protein
MVAAPEAEGCWGLLLLVLFGYGLRNSIALKWVGSKLSAPVL